MRGLAALFSHNGTSDTHYRLPIWISDSCDQYFTSFKIFHLFWRSNNMSFALTNLLTNTHTLHQYLTFLLQIISFNSCYFRLKFYSLSVFSPFDIHRMTIVLLNLYTPFRKLNYFIISQTILFLITNFYFFLFSTNTSVNQFHFLTTQTTTDNRFKTSFYSIFKNIKLIWRNLSFNHIFTQTVRSVDEHNSAKTGFSIQCKHYARSTKVRPHHFLHPNRQRDGEMIKTFGFTI